jgi:endonuclease G
VTDPAVKAAARAVVKLFIQEGDLTESCTGFLIGPQMVMTNQHCLATAADCANTVALFDYDTSTMVPASQQRRCRKVEHSSQTYDYTTFDLDGPSDPTITALSFGAHSAVDGQALTVIEHPGGEPKQVSYTHCTANHDPVNGYGTNSDFTHTCATLTGASGSPMLDASMKVVGLHHLGQTDDERIYNRAVRIEPIITELNTPGTQ